MTDERQGDGLWTAIERLPRGSGVIFRHYSLPPAERRALFAAVRRVARRRRLTVVRAGPTPFQGEAGVHGRSAKRSKGLRTWPAHDMAEVLAGRRAGADVILISPIFATRSHPDGRPLGVLHAARLAQAAGGRAVALGGMNATRFRRLRSAGFIGWGAVDGWQGVPPDQKRRAVPT